MAEAVAWLDAALSPQPVGRQASTITVADWGDLWHQTYVVPLSAPNTARWYLYALQQLATLYGVLLADVRQSALQGIVGTLAARLDANTVQAIVGVWRRCFDAAVDDELIVRNPAKRLALPRPGPPAPQRHVTPAEVAALWPAIEGHRFEAAYALLIGCGLRIGEVLGLAWESVDLAGARAWIGPQYTNGHWRKAPKGRNPHYVTLPPRVVASLIRHRNNQRPGAVLVMESHAVRPGRTRRKGTKFDGPQPWSQQVVSKDLVDVCKAAGLDPLGGTHAGRRGLITALLDGGVPVASVAERVGHANPGTTMKFYAKASEDGRRRADEATDAYLGGGPGTDSDSQG